MQEKSDYFEVTDQAEEKVNTYQRQNVLLNLV
jgi:hypothetical protein